jgi:hypothetical protein
MKKIREEDRLNHFLSKVDIRSKDECWEWQGSFRTNGYGSYCIKRKEYNASRASWILHFGAIPNNIEVCHKCDNRKCVNPNHLFLGTHKENMYDAIKKGRVNNPPVNYGKDNTSTKLSENKVKTIFRLHRKGITKAELSRKFGVTKQAICLVLNRTNWSYVDISS